MKRPFVQVRPGSRAVGRALVDSAELKDLIRRHEVVAGLLARALKEISVIEAASTRAEPGAARRLLLDVVSKRKFAAMLEERLLYLTEEVDRRQKRILADAAS